MVVYQPELGYLKYISDEFSLYKQVELYIKQNIQQKDCIEDTS
jgi:hypothetical protein